MKKLISTLCLIAMLLCLLAPVGAMASAADKNQVTNSGGTFYYDAYGSKVNGDLVTNFGADDSGAIVSVTKTAQQYTVGGVPQENQFLVELQVQTTQDLLKLSSGSPDAAVTLILDTSSSMTECVYCSHKEDESCHEGNGSTKCAQGYKSRMQATEEAAKAFLDSFAAMGTTDLEAGAAKPRRMVSIVLFNQNATLKQAYIDVSNANNLQAVKNAITNLSTAQGTNIEGALQLAHNVIDHGRANASRPIYGIDYLYTVLLTDGEPSMGMTNYTDRSSTQTITGGQNGSWNTEYADIDEAKTNADAIKSVTSQSRLYSICLGKTIYHVDGSSSPVANEKRFGNWPALGVNRDTTLGEWLSSLSTHNVYTDALTASVLDNFNSIMSQIQVAAQAWDVRDTMGDHMNFVSAVPVTSGSTNINNVTTVENDVISWNLLRSNYDPAITEYDHASHQGILGYTYRYIVTLDNLGSGYSGGPTPANASAVLDYAVENTETGEYSVFNNKPFAVPEVEGYTGSLSFKKVDDKNNPVTNMTFHIDSPDNASFRKDVTYDASTGMYTVTGLPSGHSYHLHEQTVPGYAPLGEMEFRVDWANTDITEKSGVFYEDSIGAVTLVNTIVEHGNNPINLTINKQFFVGDTELSANDPLLANVATGYAKFTLDYPVANDDHFYLNKNALSTSYVDLREGSHTVTETAQALPGYELVSTSVTVHDSNTNTTRTYENAAAATFDAVRLANAARTYTLTFKNVYRQKTGLVTVNKTFWKHALSSDGTSETGTTQLTSGFGGVQAKLELYSAANPTVVLAETTLTGNTWSWNLGALPEGEYIIKEASVQGEIDGYDYQHSLFTGISVNGGAEAALSQDAAAGYRFSVRDGHTYALSLQNHYLPYNADLHLFKHFHGDIASSDAFVEIFGKLTSGTIPEIAVDIYVGNVQPDQTAGATKYATLILNENNDWNATLNDIPAGTYSIIESGTGAQLPGYDLTINHPIVFTVDRNSHDEIVIKNLGNTYTRKTGSVKVQKVFDTNGDITDAEKNALQIPVQLVRVSDRHVQAETLLTASGNWEHTFQNVPFDEYELIEIISSSSATNTAHVNGYSLVARWFDSAFVTMDNWNDDSTIERTVTNTYSTVFHPLTIQKITTGVTPPADYAVSIDLVRMVSDGNGGYVEDDSFELDRITLNSGNNFTATAQLPNGTYHLRESVTNAPLNYTNTPAFSLTGTSDHITFNPTTGVLTVAGQAGDHNHNLTLTVTNNYTPDNASITVNKNIGGQLSSDLFNTKVFYVDLYKVGENNPVGLFELYKNQDFTDTIRDLDPAAQYYLVERDPSIPDYKNSVVWTHNYQVVSDNSTPSQTTTFTPGAGANLTFNLTNTYTRTQGSPLTIAKSYSFVNQNETMDVDNAQVTVIIDPVNAQIGMAQSMTLTLTGMQSQQLNLPVGRYKITEVTAPEFVDYTQTGMSITIGTQTGTNGMEFDIAENTPISISIQNTYTRNAAELTLSKTFAGDIKDVDVASVVLTVTESNGIDAAKVTLPDNGSWNKTISLPTDTYTVSEQVTLKTGMILDDFAHTRKWTVDNTVTTDETAEITLTTNASVSLALENIYTRKQVPVTVQKTFGGDLNESDVESITLELSQNGSVLVFNNPLVLNAANGFKTEFYLPTGTYSLKETVALKASAAYPLSAYANTITWSMDSVAGAGLTQSTDGTAQLTLSNGNIAGLSIGLKNEYTLNPAGITFTKEFVGYTEADMPDKVTFTLSSVDGATAFNVELTAADADPANPFLWIKTVDVPVGVYSVYELVAQPADSTKRVVSTIVSPADNQVSVEPNSGVVVQCINRMENTLSVRLPLVKNIVQGGTLPPSSQMQFRFLIKGGLPNGVSMNFAAESGGSIQNYDAKTRALDVLLDNSTAFKGYVEFTGFGDALAGVKVSISEDLYPYLNADEAAKAGWKYDATSYELSLEGSTVDAVKTSLTCNGKPATAVAFGNTFTQNMPVIPETGDSSSLLLSLLALCGSAMAILLIRKRKLNND